MGQGLVESIPEVAVDARVRVGSDEVEVAGEASSTGVSASRDTRIGESTTSANVSAGSEGLEANVAVHTRTELYTGDFEATERVVVTDEGVQGSSTIDATFESDHASASYRTETTEDGDTTTEASAAFAVGEVAADADVSVTGLGGSPVAGTVNAVDAAVDGVEHTVDSAADGARVIVDTIDDAASAGPHVEPIHDAGTTVTHDTDGTTTIDQFGEIGVEVGGTRVTIGQEGTLSTDGTTMSASGDSGVQVESGGEQVGTGVTASVSSVDGDDRSGGGTDLGVFAERGDDRIEAGVTSDQVTTDGGLDSDTTLGGYVETGGERVEGGVFVTSDQEHSALHDQTVGSEVGAYAGRNDDEVRAGFENRSNSETFDSPPTKGVFVEDTDGDRTGVGTIGAIDMKGDVNSVGTDGLYVDVDGERHDAHATFTAGTDGTFAGGQVEVDPGPVSITGRVGMDEDASPVVDGEIDSEFGSLDDLLPDELLDDPETSAHTPSDPVTVHDELGNPISELDTATTLDDAPAPDLNEATDSSMFGDVADTIGDAAGDAFEAVQDFFDDLVGGGDE